MATIQSRLVVFLATVAVLIATSSGALAQKIYDVGATDTEIKIGNIMPYSGPASSYGVTGRMIWRVMPAISEGSPLPRCWSAVRNQFQHLAWFASLRCAG